MSKYSGRSQFKEYFCGWRGKGHQFTNLSEDNILEIVKMGLLTLIFQIFLLGIGAIILYLFYIERKHRNYFGKWGMGYTGTGIFRVIRFIRGKLSLPEAELLLYEVSKKEAKGPFVGYTDSFVTPTAYITDLDLARSIFVKNFDNFTNRRKFLAPKGDQLFHKMFSLLENEQWKGMRAKLSPTFTTGKIRRLFNIFERSSGRMCNYLKKEVGTSGGEVDIPEVYSKYAMDVIANCVFGIDSKTFEFGPGQISKFEEMAQLLQFKFDPKIFLKIMLVLAAPKVADFFGVEAVNPAPQRYFKQVIHQVLKHRRETGERQDDFLQLMMEIQKGLSKEEMASKEVLEVMTGTSDAKSWDGGDSSKLTFDDDDIAANSTLFLLAGFDTLHSLLTYATYSLALNQEVQQKLLEEVRANMAANGGKLSYDSVHEMKYLDMFINETLRLYPPATRTERICTNNFSVPSTNAVIEKGVLVILPILGVHRDPQYYDNPFKFDPDRFLPENKSERHPYSFIPFGSGPRNCIGMRFALTEAKTIICSLVSNFHLEPCERTEIPATFANSTTLKPANGMWLHMRARSEDK